MSTIKSLLDVKQGERVRIVRIDGGYGLAVKLRQLGLTPGEIARVLRQAPFGGPIQVEVGGRRIALGRGVASRVLVTEVDECVSP